MRKRLNFSDETHRVKALMRRLPPGATVRAVDGQRLLCPAPGLTAEVVLYSPGSVGVVYPDGDTVHHCQPAWLEIVGFHTHDHTGQVQDLTWVARVLDGP